MHARAKKLAVEMQNVTVNPVVVQSVVVDSMSEGKLVLSVTMPGNVTEPHHIDVEFLKESNGSVLIVWVPRGIASCSIDAFKTVLCRMGDRGIYILEVILSLSCYPQYETVVFDET
jgi:hypothetical protein